MRCFRSSAQVSASDQKSDGFSDTSSVDEAIEIQGATTASNSKAHTLELDYKDLWALALTTALGGHYLPWSHGLSAGFGSFMIATVLIGSAYVCLMLSSAETSSALPFAGGSYGVARVTLGNFPGYLVGCADALKSILYTSAAATTIANMFTFCVGSEEKWEPVYCLVFYVLSLSVHCYGGRLLWLCFAVFSITSFLLLIVYLLGSSKYGDLPEHAPMYKDQSDNEYDRWFHGGMYKFMHALPFPSWFFIGIQNINLACGEMLDPKKDVPKGYLAAISTVVLTSFSAILVAVSIHPGTSVLQHKPWPLTRGYEKMFHIGERAAAFMSLPASVSAGFGFMFFYGRQLRAMGESGMVNPIFAKELPDRHTPVGALVIGSLVGYGLCLLTHFDARFLEPLYNLSRLCAYFTYSSIFLSFLVFRRHFPTITREYVSPLGNAGALFGMAVFALAFASVCGFYVTHYAIAVLGVLLVIVTIYYYTVVEKRQVFSEEEKKVMFKAYLVKGNAATKNRLKKGNSPANRSGQRSAERKSPHASGTSPKSASASPRASRSTMRHGDASITTATESTVTIRSRDGGDSPHSVPSTRSAGDSASQRVMPSTRSTGAAGIEMGVYSAVSVLTEEDPVAETEVAAEADIP